MSSIKRARPYGEKQMHLSNLLPIGTHYTRSHSADGVTPLIGKCAEQHVQLAKYVAGQWLV